MVSLPIPDTQSQIRYEDIYWQEYNLGSLVSDLTGGRVHYKDFAHLDPDINSQSLGYRHPQWKPIFGQTGAAQGHLSRNNVRPGDVFLFFGLFRNVLKVGEKFIWDRRSRPRHVLWGWLQIEEIVKLNKDTSCKYGWANYHPHFNRKYERNDTLYISTKYIKLSGVTTSKLSGAGTFLNFSGQLALSAAGAILPSQWELPEWCFPRGGAIPLTYHSNVSRWKKSKNGTRLSSVARGQEFILDTEDFPEGIEWVKHLLQI
jgi:hypothetical protein